MLDWIADHYGLRHEQLRQPSLPMMVSYIRQQASAINAYKAEAEQESISGSDTALSCTAEKLAEQLRLAVDLLPAAEIKSNKFAFSDAPTSLAWKGAQFEVLCHDVPKPRGGCLCIPI